MEDKFIDYTYFKQSIEDDDMVKMFILKIQVQIGEYIEKIDKFDKDDYSSIYADIHSVKGISSYCFPKIYKLTSKMCENMKSKKYDNLQENLDKLKKEYKNVLIHL